MNLLRKILFPFSILYGLITSIRNFLYNNNIFRATTFEVPIIVVGNLSVGGTGKSPQIEYLIRLLSPKYKIATLSRGYKRKSKGFILANANSTPEILGDEPFQFYKKFPEIQVAVAANRKLGIEQLLLLSEKPEVILLDDAYQHRRVKAGFYILLTTFNDIYADDYLLPSGNLRECKVGAKRANLIIVTKCPPKLSFDEKELIKKKLKLESHQQLFFSCIEYDEFVYSEEEALTVEAIKNTNKLLLAGIAKPKSFFNYLENKEDSLLTFPDHHHFSEKDIEAISNLAKDKIIITTEKDYVRLKPKLANKKLFYLPIKSNFIGPKEDFSQAIFNYLNK
jgi:tetraacyldisaccharide 4'-kinase